MSMPKADVVNQVSFCVRVSRALGAASGTGEVSIWKSCCLLHMIDQHLTAIHCRILVVMTADLPCRLFDTCGDTQVPSIAIEDAISSHV